MLKSRRPLMPTTVLPPGAFCAMSRMFHPMHCTKRTTNAGLSPKLVWRAPFARQVERSLRAPTPDGGAGISDAQVRLLCPVLHSVLQVAGCKQRRTQASRRIERNWLGFCLQQVLGVVDRPPHAGDASGCEACGCPGRFSRLKRIRVDQDSRPAHQAVLCHAGAVSGGVVEVAEVAVG